MECEYRRERESSECALRRSVSREGVRVERSTRIEGV